MNGLKRWARSRWARLAISNLWCAGGSGGTHSHLCPLGPQRGAQSALTCTLACNSVCRCPPRTLPRCTQGRPRSTLVAHCLKIQPRTCQNPRNWPHASAYLAHELLWRERARCGSMRAFPANTHRSRPHPPPLIWFGPKQAAPSEPIWRSKWGNKTPSANQRPPSPASTRKGCAHQ